jgi:zinc protease
VKLLLLALGLAAAGEPGPESVGSTPDPVLALPAAVGVSTLDLPRVQQQRLPGGAELWLVERPGAPLVALDLRLGLPPERVGPDLQAALRLLPAVVDAGGVAAPEGLDAALQPLGASVTLAATDTGLRVALVAPAARFPEALALVAGALEAPTLSRRRLRADVAAWRQAEARKLRSTGVLLHRAECRAVYAEGHLLARWPAPSAPLGRTAVRRTLALLLAEGAATVAVVGPATPEDLASALGFLGGGPADPALAASQAPEQGPAVVLLHDRGARQVRVVVSYPVPEGIGRAEAQLVADLLGGGPTARLEGRLREERGLVYEARASLVAQPGHLRLRVSTRLSASDPGPGLAGLQGELAGLSTIGEGELQRARATRLFAVARELGSLERHAARLSGQARLGEDPAALQAWLDDVAAADRTVVEGAAAAILVPEAASWLILGDAAVLDPLLDDLDLAPTREIPLSAP